MQTDIKILAKKLADGTATTEEKVFALKQINTSIGSARQKIRSVTRALKDAKAAQKIRDEIMA